MKIYITFAFVLKIYITNVICLTRIRYLLCLSSVLLPLPLLLPPSSLIFVSCVRLLRFLSSVFVFFLFNFFLYSFALSFSFSDLRFLSLIFIFFRFFFFFLSSSFYIAYSFSFSHLYFLSLRFFFSHFHFLSLIQFLSHICRYLSLRYIFLFIFFS